MPTANTKPQQVASTDYVKGAFSELSGKLNEVYTKKAIDEAVQDMVHAMGKLQQEIEECQSSLENLRIKYINISPFQKFKNLFRSPE